MVTSVRIRFWTTLSWKNIAVISLLEFMDHDFLPERTAKGLGRFKCGYLVEFDMQEFTEGRHWSKCLRYCFGIYGVLSP